VRGADLRAIDYDLPVASAQIKSCVLLAALLAEGRTTLTEPGPSRDHTERMLRAAGVQVDSKQGRITLTPPKGGALALERVDVPGDFSSAAFFVVAALIVGGSAVRIEDVGLNPTRTGLLSVLERMGAGIGMAEDEPEGRGAGEEGTGEPVGTIEVHSSPLGGTEVGRGEIPATIDELPLVGLLGCFARGETLVRGAGELRHKESDRIGALVEGLRGLGAEIDALDDGFVVQGTGGLRGGVLDSRGDHRLAMLGAVAGLASEQGVTVLGAESIRVSYPGFEEHLRSLL
jgi:3-phosphoshikimate 1-carboxyvinyltransferase